jgi:alcohol dehydrogenase YqhD (iron-dependent ADH family)
MLNFELYNPTNLVFWKGQIEKLSTLVPQGAKILWRMVEAFSKMEFTSRLLTI